ncbi:unnamed protein product [Rotaria sordida]|uniref:Uncharacterized protein n=1 Tax=Rotaria sordida TaxID=392033 RepID=A0A814U0D5_9BILA|nr:unnamed protein product [Rotaria sordida]CAF3560984.1 unnamed protein product [Rotaria sordida]
MPTYEIPRDYRQDTKGSTTPRSFVDESTQYTPVTEYPSSSAMSSRIKQSASMYRLESRYQPITKGNQQSSPPIFFVEPVVVAQPMLYNIPNAQTTPIFNQSTSSNKQPSIPTFYSINGQSRRLTVDMNTNNLDHSNQVINESPILYSMINRPPSGNQIQESNKQYLQQQPPPPTVYSIVGSAARTSRGVQVSTLDTVQPIPILYTITGDTSTPINTPKENVPPPTVTKPSNDIMMYSLDNETNVPRKQQQQQQQPIQPIQPTTLYALVSRPLSPSKKSTTIIPTERINRNVERKPETIHEEIISYPIIKAKQEPQAKESKNPKSQALLIPLNDDEYRTRAKVAHQSPLFYSTPEQTQRNPYTTIQNQPIQLSDYHSPYEYRKQKPYRERKYTNNPLPVVSNNRLERKTKPQLNETRSRIERQQLNVPSKSTSLERYPVNRNARLGLWDAGYQTQTDDEEYVNKYNKKKRNRKTMQPRAPWIPVW